LLEFNRFHDVTEREEWKAFNFETGMAFNICFDEKEDRVIA